jgi:chemotaxis protein CheD
MGEWSVASDGSQLRTLLGSCVGLALHDRRQKVGGLAHIVLPTSRGDTARPGKFVDTAVPTLIKQMEALVGEKLVLTARIAGGASMFATTATAGIGLQNVQSCEQVLAEMGIRVVAKHCGGEQGRRMTIDTADGAVLIEIVGQEPIKL